MKLASSSASFGAALAAGDLTQLEWLDLCARELRLDGVVFEARHFPRTDDEYLAQLKKLAADLGLTVAALGCDVLLAAADGTDGAPSRWLEVATTLGAPVAFSTTPAADASPSGWNELVARAKPAALDAKRCNVVLGVRNAPGTLCAAAADLTQLGKEVDSSWLRYAIDIAALDPPEAPAPLLPKTVVALHATAEDALGDPVAALGDFRGFLVVDRDAPGTDSGPLARSIAAARRSIAESVLAQPNATE